MVDKGIGNSVTVRGQYNIHFQLQKKVTHTPTSRRNERIDH